FGNGLLAIVDKPDEAVLEKVLGTTDASESLAADATYKAWTAKLLAQRSATVFAHFKEGGEQVHVVLVTQKEKNLGALIFYTGTLPSMHEVFAHMGKAGAPAFGPLPLSTITAVSINVNFK